MTNPYASTRSLPAQATGTNQPALRGYAANRHNALTNEIGDKDAAENFFLPPLIPPRLGRS